MHVNGKGAEVCLRALHTHTHTHTYTHKHTHTHTQCVCVCVGMTSESYTRNVCLYAHLSWGHGSTFKGNKRRFCVVCSLYNDQFVKCGIYECVILTYVLVWSMPLQRMCCMCRYNTWRLQALCFCVKYSNQCCSMRIAWIAHICARQILHAQSNMLTHTHTRTHTHARAFTHSHAPTRTSRQQNAQKLLLEWVVYSIQWQHYSRSLMALVLVMATNVYGLRPCNGHKCLRP